MTRGACEKCGLPGARTHLDNVLLCDPCADKRISELTGLPLLPDPPPPMTLRDGEGGRRTLAFRIWRAPTGVEVVVEETGVPIGEGYERAVLGAHDAEVDVLVARLREIASEEVGKRQLEPNPHREGWLLVDDVVEGRLVWSAECNEVGAPYKVLVDGRLLTWNELGRALEGYEGWRFRIELADRIDDLRPDADVIALQVPMPRMQPQSEQRSLPSMTS
jgi:hypothetical protein